MRGPVETTCYKVNQQRCRRESMPIERMGKRERGLMNRIGRTIQPEEGKGGEWLLSSDSSLVAV
jgi:hypothetical protein